MRSIERGSRFTVGLSDADRVEVTVVVDAPFPGADGLVRAGLLDEAIARDAVLVQVAHGDRVLFAGTWMGRTAAQRQLADGSSHLDPVPAAQAPRLDPPIVVTGSDPAARLVWGPVVRPVSLAGAVSVPQSCRPQLHTARELARLSLIALNRRDEINSVLWRDPARDVPWGDVRLSPHGRTLLRLADLDPSIGYERALAAASGR